MIERIGAECAALDMPFFLEPVGYDPGGLDPKSAEFARIKPNIVVETMKEFSLDKYGVDVLKVEFPVSAAFVPDVWTREQALGFFRAADQAATRPYIYLSAGVDIDRFTGSLELAAASGARFSGVLCGRASWQGGVPVFAREGREAFERWLEAEGVRNVQAINDCLRAAVPWTERLRAG
jgi:tagatose 1,6-diphosphate aldolase